MNFLGSALGWSVLWAALLFLFPAVSAGQTPTHRAPGKYSVMQNSVGVTYPPALVQKGRALFQQDCSFCHGRDAGGGETGPDLTRSKLVTADVDGDKIGAVVRSGRPDKGMPRFDFSDEEIASLTAFIHTQQNNAAANKGARKGVDVSDLQTGNAEAGKRYFNGTGGCAACHSATGDLAGIASRYQGLELEHHQESQGLGDISLPKGDRFAYYKLVDSVVESPKDKDGHEQDFFDGIDTSLPGRLGDEGKKIPGLREKFEEIQRKVVAAERAGSDAAAMDAALEEAEGVTESLLVVNGLPSAWYLQTVPYLDGLLTEIQQARALLSGTRLAVTLDAPVGESPERAFMAVPGKPLELTAKLSVEHLFHKRAEASIRLQLPKGWKSQELKREQSEEQAVCAFSSLRSCGCTDHAAVLAPAGPRERCVKRH